MKLEPLLGVAVNVTWVPASQLCAQTPGQEISPSPLVIVPVPEPVAATVRPGAKANVAVTVWSESIVTVQGPVPEQLPPLQPVKAESSAGVAVRVTLAPAPSGTEHALGHEIESSALVTVPEPVPAVATVSA